MAFLMPNDLVAVKRFLNDAKRKWYNIGLELRVKASKLDEIQAKHGTDYDACLREMLQIWLRFYPNKPTWSRLADALKEQAVAENKLSDEGMCVHGLILWVCK